jgi:hypothetical protein
MVNMEKPAEFNRAVLGFLRGGPPSEEGGKGGQGGKRL